MSEYFEAFSLGNAAILTNVCLLPLYPGLVVMLTARMTDDGARWARRFIGLVVLAGVVTFMVVVGFVLHQLRSSVADILPWLLPTMYALVAALGAAMIAGFNPFVRMASASSPLLRSPTASAYVYGMMLAPMTLPCTGPLVISAFVIGGVSGTGALADSLGYFVAFSLGFGWPLVVLPFLAVPAQRHITRFLGRHHRLLATLSGILLLGVASVGFWLEVRPST